MEYNTLICGGTFDFLHKGHKAFLLFGLSHGKKLIIGLTSDKYIQDHKNPLIEPFVARKNALIDFLQKEKLLDRVHILSIDDMYGPTLSKDFVADAMLVSQETTKGATLINQKRQELGLAPFPLLICDMVLALDGERISSDRIRKGIINKIGEMAHTLYLTPELRKTLQKPIGDEITKEELQHVKTDFLITVGDIVTQTANQLGLNQKISIIDFVVQRKMTFSHITEHGFLGTETVIKAKNSPGTLTPNLFAAIEKAFANSSRVVVIVDGEEDLAVLPVVLFAPLDAVVVYGQPNKAMIAIRVTQEIKEKVHNIISEFSLKTN